MATIKSYTDIEQSKKLAEILPLKSADMVLLHEEPYETSDSKFDGLHQALYVPFSKYDKSWSQKYKNISYFPCWSLAALLGVIPYNITFNKAVYRFKLVKFPDHWECYHENFGSVSTEIFKADNPLDACYEMIIRLNELKML